MRYKIENWLRESLKTQKFTIGFIEAGLNDDSILSDILGDFLYYNRPAMREEVRKAIEGLLNTLPPEAS